MSNPTFTIAFGIMAPTVNKILTECGFGELLGDYEFTENLNEKIYEGVYNGNSSVEWSSSILGVKLNQLDGYMDYYSPEKLFSTEKSVEYEENYWDKLYKLYEYLNTINLDRGEVFIETIKKIEPKYYIICGTD